MQHRSAPAPQHTHLIRSLMIGAMLLLIGLALGLKLREPALDVRAEDTAGATSLASGAAATRNPDAFSAKSVPLTDAALDAAATTPDPINADAQTSQPDIDVENFPQPTDFSEAEEPDPAILARRQEIQFLQEALPDNRMLPLDKTPEQLDAMWAEFQQFHHLQQRMDAGQASVEEVEQYYAIRMAKYEEEKALLELCDSVATNSLAQPTEQEALLCQHMAAGSTERLQVIEDAIAELEQQRLAGLHGE